MDNSLRKTLRVCRICSTKVKLELLFLHRPRDIVQILTGFANVTIEKTDELPQHICKKCIRKVNEVHDFKTQCEEADRKFRDALKEPPKLEPEPEPEPEPEKAEEIKTEPTAEETLAKPKNEFHEITIKCEPAEVYDPEDGEGVQETQAQNCDDETDYDLSESEDFQYDDTGNGDDDEGQQDDNENIEQDTKKDLNFLNESENQQGGDNAEQNETTSQTSGRKRKTPIGIIEPKEMVQCPLCLKYYSKDVIKQHKPKHTINDPICSICKISETSDRGLGRHIKAVHNLNPRTMLPIDPMECKDCYQIFYNYREFIKHQKTHRKKFECSTCHLTFDQIIFLKHHEKKHVGQAKDGGYACDICGITCSQRVNLRRHYAQVHSTEKPFSCEHCSKAFPTKEARNQHATIHMEKFLVCHICGKGYSCQVKLNVHIKWHAKKESEGKDPIYRRSANYERRVVKDPTATTPSRKNIYYRKCPVCARDIVHSNFKVHMMSHTGERPFKCTQCGKGFYTAGILNDHMRIHSDEKPHKCDDCESSFRLLREWKAHKRAHCDIQYHHCQFCDRAFARKNNCMAHERTHTGVRPFVCELCGEGYGSSNNLKRHKRSRHNILE